MTETEGKIMKKILIATTALVATAGVAAADITLSGHGVVGLLHTPASTGTAAAVDTADAALDAAEAAYAANATVATARAVAAAQIAADAAADANGVTTAASTDMIHRVQVNLNASTTTDAGVTIGLFSRIRSEQSDSTEGMTNGQFTISAGDFTLAAGNTTAAIASRTNYFGPSTSGVLGYEGLYEMGFGVLFNSNGLIGADRIRADYTMGNTTISISGDVSGAERQEIAISSNINGLNVSAGYANDQTWAVDANYSMNGAMMGARMTDGDSAIYGGYSMGGFAFNAYATDANASGVVASLDLGGGASATLEAANSGLVAGYVSFNF
jgi:outer membrane protein OmpU